MTKIALTYIILLFTIDGVEVVRLLEDIGHDDLKLYASFTLTTFIISISKPAIISVWQ